MFSMECDLWPAAGFGFQNSDGENVRKQCPVLGTWGATRSLVVRHTVHESAEYIRECVMNESI
jgi:hypothetical protein